MTQLFCVLRVGDHQVGTLLAEARGCAPVVWKHELHFNVTTEQCATVQVMVSIAGATWCSPVCMVVRVCQPAEVCQASAPLVPAALNPGAQRTS